MIAKRVTASLMQWKMFGGGPIAAFGGQGTTDGQFQSPREIAVVPEQGRVYIVDKGNHRVEVFSLGGEYVATIGGVKGSAPNQLNRPWGLAVADDLLFVSDRLNNCVKVRRVTVAVRRLTSVVSLRRHTPCRGALMASLDFPSWSTAGWWGGGGVCCFSSSWWW